MVAAGHARSRAAPGDGDSLSRRLVDRSEALLTLSSRAQAFDREAGAPLAEHAVRDEALDVLRASLIRLREAVLRLDAISPVSDPQSAWRSLERTFDVAGDASLAELVQSAISRETRSLALKRQAADLSLQRLRILSSIATIGIVGLALLLSLLLARGLRRPLADMATGAAALSAGDLGHRIPVRADDEFGQLAHGVNAMAVELAARRRQETQLREGLERRVAEQTHDLQEAVGALQLSERRRRRLIAEISHELRTPTTAIRGEAEIAMRGGPKAVESYRASLERIGEAAIQLGEVINDLLTVAHSDADELKVSMAKLDLRDVFAAAVAQARGAATARGIVLVHAAPVGAVPVVGDAQRLRQVVGLLLDNAVRYSHSDGEVAASLDMSRADGKATVSIVDAGIGVAQEDVARIFERQHRGANARRHRPDGAGLGLAIARDLAARHGGGIEVERLPVGSRFTLTLPLDLDALREAA